MSGQDEIASICPTPKLIAFATSVVRSKPPELSVKEYLTLLRQHVAKGRSSDALSSTHRHLDRSSFWRSEYTRTKIALKSAEDQAVDLRQEVDSLKRKVEALKTSNPSKKRKKQDEDSIPVPLPPRNKRRAASASPTRFISLEIVEDGELDEAGDTGAVLMRSVFDIHATIKRPGKLDSAKLAYHLVNASSTVSEIVGQSVSQCLTQQPPDLEQLRRSLTVAGRASASIFMGYNRLRHIPEGGGVQGKVTHAIVQMFGDILAEFQKVVFADTVNAEPDTTTTKVKKSVSSKAKSKSKTTRSTPNTESAVLGGLTNLLSNITNSLDPTLDSNRALFEGFAYCVLDRLGGHLYSTVFGRPKAPTIEAEIFQSKIIDEIEDNDAEPLRADDKLIQMRIRTEAPYLVFLLNRIMILAPAHLGSVISAKTGKPKQANNKRSMKGALAVTAKECLQSTLVNAVFGTDGSDENDPLMDCLKFPMAGDITVPMPKVKEEEVGQWFKNEIWRLLGWEILSKGG